MAQTESNFDELPKDDPDGNSKDDPDQQRPPDNGGGDDPPHPPLFRVTSISPIGGVLAGGINVTLHGVGFQPEVEVYFGTVPSPEVNVLGSNQITAKVPPASQVGNVVVQVVNPDGRFANAPGGFTYVTSEGSLHAEVFGVTPLSVIEDTESEITIRGRNLIAAYNDGIVALRGPGRVQITSSNFSSSTDPGTGIESLVLSVRITATPPLEQHERMAIQVLVSVRPEAGGDGVFESSRQMFTLLPRAVPVLLAYTPNLRAGQPNLVLVAGKNLKDCSLSFGKGTIVHTQQSDDDTLSSIVTVGDASLVELTVVDSTGSEAGRFDLVVGSGGKGNGSASEASETGGGELSGERIPVEPLTLTPAPGQIMIGPTKEDSAVFSLGNQQLSPSWGIYFQFAFILVDIDIVIPLFNEVRIIPFFDNGIGDPSDTVHNIPAINPQVGQLFKLRGMGLLITLRVEIQIRIQVVVIIGFIIDIWPFGFFNEFGDIFPFAIGTIVISIWIIIEVFLLIAFLVALIRPDGTLRTLFFFNVVLGFDVIISADLHHLTVDGHFIHFVRHTRIGPRATTLLPCDGRFELASDNGQTEFIDEFGASQSFYFARAAGECCVPWDFQLELVRFEQGGPEETIQSTFRADLCLNAFASEGQSKVVIVSTRTPNGYPPPLRLNLGETDELEAFAVPVDQNGNEIPNGNRRNLSEEGLVEFYLENPINNVLNRPELTPGNAIAEETGNNIIRVDTTSVRILDDTPAAPLYFWPPSVLGFNILSFLARGLAPAVRTGNLPVEVSALQDTITVTPVLAYEDPGGQLLEATSSVIERLEPFETLAPHRKYVLAVKLGLPPLLARNQTLTIKVDSVSMTPQRPLANIPNAFLSNRDSAQGVDKFFTGNLVVVNQTGTIAINSHQVPGANELVKVANLEIQPNNVEVGNATAGITAFVPPGRAVANRDVQVAIGLSLSGGSGVNIRLMRPQLQLTVANDETYEEYLRVFYQATEILSSADHSDSTLKNFDSTLFAALTAGGATATVLRTNGDALFTHACDVVETLRDDRPLYWSRLRAIGSLRAYARRQPAPVTGPAQAQLVKQFELASRGLDANGSISFDLAPPNARKAMVTGFDPFALSSSPREANSSGVIALAFHKKPLGTVQSPVHVRSAIFPVRYADFDAGMIEAAVERNMDSTVMLMTCSLNGSRNFYDLERWAGKNRLDAADNNRVQAPGTVISTGTPPVASDVKLMPNFAATAKQFLESTLPYDLIITSDPVTRTLPGPAGAQTSFVMDQSYKILETTATTQTNGEFHPEPTAASADGYTKAVPPDVPNQAKTADFGSGGNFLSNEIFYRTAQVRERAVRGLASGHFHLPPFVAVNLPDPAAALAAENAQRDRLISGVRTAFNKLVASRFRMRSLGNLTFPDTVKTQTSHAMAQARNETNAPINVWAELMPANSPFTIETPVPASASANAAFSLQIKFTPPAAGAFTATLTARETDANGELLFTATVTGQGIDQPPPPVVDDFSPKFGILGDLVTIVGRNLDGATQVKIGNAAINIMTVTPTFIEAEISGPPRTGKISVTTPSGTGLSAVNYAVHAPPHHVPE
jgi:pyrrolidone-carboxylate peptidase